MTQQLHQLLIDTLKQYDLQLSDPTLRPATRAGLLRERRLTAQRLDQLSQRHEQPDQPDAAELHRMHIWDEVQQRINTARTTTDLQPVQEVFADLLDQVQSPADRIAMRRQVRRQLDQQTPGPLPHARPTGGVSSVIRTRTTTTDDH